MTSSPLQDVLEYYSMGEPAYQYNRVSTVHCPVSSVHCPLFHIGLYRNGSDWAGGKCQDQEVALVGSLAHHRSGLRW